MDVKIPGAVGAYLAQHKKSGKKKCWGRIGIFTKTHTYDITFKTKLTENVYLRLDHKLGAGHKHKDNSFVSTNRNSRLVIGAKKQLTTIKKVGFRDNNLDDAPLTARLAFPGRQPRFTRLRSPQSQP